MTRHCTTGPYLKVVWTFLVPSNNPPCGGDSGAAVDAPSPSPVATTSPVTRRSNMGAAGLAKGCDDAFQPEARRGLGTFRPCKSLARLTIEPLCSATDNNDPSYHISSDSILDPLRSSILFFSFTTNRHHETLHHPLPLPVHGGVPRCTCEAIAPKKQLPCH